MLGMAKKFGVLFFLLLIFLLPSEYTEGKEPMPKIGPVKLNVHRSDLAGKTVLLRWNGKMNGDKYLSRLGSLLTNNFKDIKIIKVWENNSETAVISKKIEISEQIATKLAAMKPDLVIAAQAD